jgi:hypothetical protein
MRMDGNRITEALNLLEAKGYPEFTNFHEQGAGFAATVRRKGRSFAVHVNPDTGRTMARG